ncbi:MAG: CDP-diacylglycerol--serine O-phosphatidyltransferase [Candidatus Xenolissoclinum pacificiensis L6]|uniref:CDP-diacylglycerol--serine O-phosphatidyltransferase n=1 Tax=Candidatus Xenolissoclinum pacificiensis L6 TaxID=1401685 RepID=W2V234_9RICK|nr:MAG: CDP-diacylglycerol--serine O-phosphatidyltransferase [Candidatus Xenolissoclinum pacificiensis L6]
MIMNVELDKRHTNNQGNKIVPLYKLFPHVVTLLSMCSGLTAIKLTFSERWEMSVFFIVIATVLDGVDGSIARFLHAESNFGAHLDSLSDFLNFGVAPALLIYFWSLIHVRFIGWLAIMGFVVCMVIRLARFGSEDSIKHNRKFFFGVPAPAGAILVMIPTICSFQIVEFFPLLEHFINNNSFVEIYVIFVSILVISRIPTISLKEMPISQRYTYAVLTFFGLNSILLFTFPWMFIPVVSAVYILVMPVSVFCFLYSKNK